MTFTITDSGTVIINLDGKPVVVSSDHPLHAQVMIAIENRDTVFLQSLVVEYNASPPVMGDIKERPTPISINKTRRIVM